MSWPAQPTIQSEPSPPMRKSLPDAPVSLSLPRLSLSAPRTGSASMRNVTSPSAVSRSSPDRVIATEPSSVTWTVWGSASGECEGCSACRSAQPRPSNRPGLARRGRTPRYGPGPRTLCRSPTPVRATCAIPATPGASAGHGAAPRSSRHDTNGSTCDQRRLRSTVWRS